MTTFCTDVDLLHWEPSLLRESAFASQTLISGTGNLAGTSFTIASGSFLDAKVQLDHVIKLGAPLEGTYPIVAVDAADELTLSVLYDGLFPADEQTARQPGPIGSASDIAYSIHTFYPQRAIVSELLLQASGLRPDQGQAILNPTGLRRACTLGSLQLIYSALAAAAAEPADFAVRSHLYERLYRRALRNAMVEIDLNGDGTPESRRALNVVRLTRG